MRLSSYPKYKPSGIEWLCGIPEHWEVKRLRYIAKINPVKSEVANLSSDTEVSFVPMEAICEFGGLVLDETRLLGDVYQGYTFFRDGDIVLAKITPCFENGKGSIAQGLTNGIGFGTTELHVIRPTSELDSKFFFYVSMSIAFRQPGEAEMYGAGGQKRVPDSFVRNYKMPVPPLPEQRAVAGFLDHKTERIDALIKKKERQIELLQEKRTAIISHAITKGLNPNVKMKDSGIEWLGEIPEHWEVLECKFGFSIQLGKMLQNEPQTPKDERVPYLKALHVQWESVDITDLPEMWASSEDIRKYSVQSGDLLVCEGGEVGRAGILWNPPAKCIIQNALHRVRPKGDNCSQYLMYLLEVVSYRGWFDILCNKATIAHFTGEKFGWLSIALPPPNEQRAIVKFLEQETAQIDTLIEKIRKSIELLREYRTALITSAVTGKIDVRKENTVVRKKDRKEVNIYFKRAVLAAEIVHQLHNEPTFGRTKLHKVFFICEHHAKLPDMGTQYYRQAMGPLDNKLIHSVESQMRKQKWYKAETRCEVSGKIDYVPMSKVGGHRKYFDKYWGDKKDKIQQIINLFRKMDTKRCEIVTTLYAAWNDLMLNNKPARDEDIIREATENWHEEKLSISRYRWLKALKWMRANGLVPKSHGKPTLQKAKN